LGDFDTHVWRRMDMTSCQWGHRHGVHNTMNPKTPHGGAPEVQSVSGVRLAGSGYGMYLNSGARAAGRSA